MVKLSVLIKGIVLYVIFVIGLTMFLQWFSNKTVLDDKIETFLQSIKEDIKNTIIRENFGGNLSSNFGDKNQGNFQVDYEPVIGQPRRPLGLPERLEYVNNKKIDVQQETDEDKIIQAVNERLKYSNMNFDNNVYTNLNNENNINYIPLATTNDFSYTPVKFDWEQNTLSNPQETLPSYTGVNIDKYSYTIPKIEYNKGFEFLPDRLGIDPAEYHNKINGQLL